MCALRLAKLLPVLVPYVNESPVEPAIRPHEASENAVLIGIMGDHARARLDAGGRQPVTCLAVTRSVRSTGRLGQRANGEKGVSNNAKLVTDAKRACERSVPQAAAGDKRRRPDGGEYGAEILGFPSELASGSGKT